ncbi:MAG: M1 family metallopeptidase [Anaerolineaceae bacterium]
MKFKNNFSKAFLLAMTVIIVLSGCASPAVPTPTATLPGPLVDISDSTLPAPTSTAPVPTNTAAKPTSFPVPQQRTHYQLQLILNYYTHFGTVDQTITYTNRTQLPMAEILLVVPPKYYSGSFVLRSLTGSASDSIQETREEGVNLYVKFKDALLPGETTTIELAYQLNFPAHEGTYGVSGRQTNLSNWYPYIPPYNEATGWIFHPQQVEDNMQVGEYVVNEISDFDVTLQLTDRQELIEIAASAPGVEKDGVWSYHLELARGFSFSVSDSYVEYEIEQDGVRIRSYCFHEHIPAGEAVTEIAAKALKLYGELYYPYPREMLSIVVADFLHNMEMDGMVMISYGVFNFYDKTPKTNLTILTPHEVSHQWFYSLIGNDQAMEPWLDEALATYNEVIYYDRYHPDLVQWWWDNRVTTHNPTGSVNSDIYISGGYTPYRNAVYLRGAMFMQEIRNTIGDEAFFASLKEYAISNTYAIGTSTTFFEVIAKHSQADLTPVLAKYFSN